MTERVRSHTCRYVETDIPAGMTILQWRAQHAAAALAVRHVRRRRRALRRLWQRLTRRARPTPGDARRIRRRQELAA